MASSKLKSIETAIKNFNLKTNFDGMTAESVNWFRQYVSKNFSRFNQKNALAQGELTLNPRPGFLYTYAYNPKTADALPYYDKFPMILCFDVTNKGWYGINFHYLAPRIRQAIFIDLLDTLNNPGFDERTKFKVTWAKLKRLSHHKYIKHACKQYLKSNLMTPMCKIDPKYWEISIFLPTQQFEKADARSVWKDI